MPEANYVAYTGPINPPGATPVLTVEQVWANLQHKVKSAETYVGAAISRTDVLSTTTDEMGHAVTERQIVFREGDRKVRERVIEFPMMKVEFHGEDGSTVMNIVSEGPKGAEAGDLWMTYAFQWLHKGDSAEELSKKKVAERESAKVAVEHTITAMRELVRAGKFN